MPVVYVVMLGSEDGREIVWLHTKQLSLGVGEAVVAGKLGNDTFAADGDGVAKQMPRKVSL